MTKCRASKAGHLLIAIVLASFSAATQAAEIQVAVASNFSAPMKKIAEIFRTQTGHTVVASYAASTKLTTQIKNGAPFLLFLSADQTEIQELLKLNLAVGKSEFTYAIGRLVLWSPQPGLALGDGKFLATDSFKRLAIANPKLAPYGRAAREVMEKLKVWERLQARLIIGENVTQTYQFVATGNAELGFVASSQVSGGSRWLIPTDLYSPLKQDAVLLEKGKANETAQLFLKFLKSEKIRDIIKEFGYDLP